MKELKGIITAMVTPFDETEKMDIPAARKMARWLVNNGVHGLFICGTNGEFHLLSDDEKVELTKAVVDEVGDDVTICAGAGCCSTQQTIALTQRLVDAGADYISVVTPTIWCLIRKIYINITMILRPAQQHLLFYTISRGKRA